MLCTSSGSPAPPTPGEQSRVCPRRGKWGICWVTKTCPDAGWGLPARADPLLSLLCRVEPVSTHMGHPSPVDTVNSVSRAQSTLS